jgi:hypothetical protein
MGISHGIGSRVRAGGNNYPALNVRMGGSKMVVAKEIILVDTSKRSPHSPAVEPISGGEEGLRF